MAFRNRAWLDTSQVRDTRGRGGGARGATIGGGGLGILGLIVALHLGVSPSDLTGGGTDTAFPQSGVVSSDLTGAADALRRPRR